MRSTVLLLAVALAARLNGADPDGDWLRFRNGDGLHGAVLNATPAALNWHPTGSAPAIQFELTNLAELQLAPRPPRTARSLHNFRVDLTNGDRLMGDVVTLDDKALTLDTWYAGRLVVKRPMLKRIEFRKSMPGVIYAGPTGLEDWKTSDSRATWTYRLGKFYSRAGSYGSLGKDVGLPDIANIEFDVAWRGQAYWNIGLYCADVRNLHVSGGYMLSGNGQHFSLNRVAAGNSRTLGNSQQSGPPSARTQAHLTIRVSKPQKTVAVFLDNVLVKQWTDPDEFAGKGTGLIFTSQGQGQIRIANIIVTEWDGKLDSTSAPTAAGTEELLQLTNNDKVSGTLRAIVKGSVALATSYAEVTIPLERVAAISFASQKAEQARRQATDVRAVFPDGTRFTVALEKLDEQALAGTTETCGRIVIPLDTFTRLQFHLYDKSAALDNEDDWGTPAGWTSDD